jgi:uncharacterized phiE125 gp8 family phage protein
MRALKPVRTVAPAAALLTTAEAKAHLRVDFTDDDTLIDSLVATATAYLDGYAGVLGRALITQTWSQAFDGLPDCGQSGPWAVARGPDRLRLPLGPLGDTVSIAYWSGGVSSAFSSTRWRALSDALGPFVQLVDGETWPVVDCRPDALTVTWTCGYGATAAAVPLPILHAAKLLVGHWYANREGVDVSSGRGTAIEVPMAVDALLMPYRAVGL